MVKTRVSVIVPVYNGEDTLKTALDSVLNQSGSSVEVEIIVINDGSTDKTRNVLDSYASTYNEVKAFHFDNAGVSIARQRGIERASFEYLLFLDADDEMAPGLLCAIEEVIHQHNSPDIIRFQSQLVNDDEHKDHHRYNCAALAFSDDPQALMNWALDLSKKYALFWLFAIKRDLFADIEFPSLNCHEDVAILPVVIAKAKSVVAIPKIGYLYTCDRATSLTHEVTMAARRSKAIDFLHACNFVQKYFLHYTKIGIMSPEHLGRLLFNFYQRKQQYFQSLPSLLQNELHDVYGEM